MLGFIPKLYPDELLYSFIARYHYYSLNISTKHTTNELFEGIRMLATPDLPINLISLLNSINVFSETEIDELIGKHTFYNFYANFIELEHRKFVKNAMCTGENKGAIHMKTGVMPSGIKEKEHFYYCTECVSDEIERLGETYWHLSHQLPGVFICTKHRIFLRESNLEFRSKKRFEFYMASEELHDHSGMSFQESKYFEQLFLIASECIYLASKNFNLINLQKIYKTLLLRQGYINGYGVVNQQKLANDFERLYGREILKLLQSSVSYDNPSCWLKAITRKHRKAFHPTRHILLILFLQETLESIEQMKDTDELPFGKGPYPCLNRAASHYRELVINDCEIRVCREINLPIGTFKCKCGYHYSRKGPDKSQGDRFKVDRVIQYGEVWIEKINKLINEQKQSYRSVARQLGVDTNTVIKYSKKGLGYSVETQNKDSLQKEIDEKKKEWLSLINNNTQLGVTKIRKMNPALYIWLYRNCKEWLQNNSPKEAKKYQTKQRIDWEKRDCEITKEVEKVVEFLKKKEPPVRITVSLIGSELGKRSLLEKHLELLPKTKSLLMLLVEDIPAFQIRRIHYIINQLKEQNQRVTEWLVRRKAGLKEELDIKVEKALKEILDLRIK